MATMSPFYRALPALALTLAAALAFSGAISGFGIGDHARDSLSFSPTSLVQRIAYSEAAENPLTAGVRAATESSIPVGEAPVALVYDASDQELFVANSESLNLTVASTTTDSPIASVSFGGQEWLSAEALDNGSDYVYVAGQWPASAWAAWDHGSMP